MKRWKTILSVLSISLLVFCTGLFAACGEKDDDDPPPAPSVQYYTVTVAPYDGEGCTVTVSAPAAAGGYVKDEEVTVTVTPALHYAVDEVKVNDEAVSLTEGKYTFKVAGDTVISATFEYRGWADIVWHETTLGALTFDADYNMTLTPEGGEAQAVTVLTAGVDLSEGFPKGDIDVKVGNTAYKVSFGTFLVFKEGYTEYTFDSDPTADFSAYEGTWKQYNSENEFVITATGATYGGNTYTEYYTAFDGSHYVKYQMTALTKPRRYFFGYLDNEKKVVYFDYMSGNVFYFTKDGTLPEAAFPAEFYGEWNNETFYTFVISAAGATIDESREVKAFAVTDAGEDAVVHAYYNGLYCKIYLQYDPTTSETEVVLYNGGISYVFTAVKPELLPTEYRGTWTALGGTETVTVDGNGNLTYEGKTRDTTRDSHDFGFHFTTEAGKRATVMYFEHSNVLALDDGNGHISYYAKGTLTGIAAASVPAGTWTSGDKTLTVSADKKITVSEGGGAAQEVMLVFAEDVVMDDIPRYNGEAIWGGIYWEFDYNKTTGEITLTKYTDFARRTTESVTFTQPV